MATSEFSVLLDNVKPKNKIINDEKYYYFCFNIDFEVKNSIKLRNREKEM